MKMHAPLQKSVYLILAVFLSYVCPAFAQNEGIGTFSDLVGQARETSPPPPPEPVTITIKETRGGRMVAEPTPTPSPPPFFSAPAVGFEYDYRLTQQKPTGGLTIDTNEIHFPFSFNLASTRLAIEYVHIWSDGSNDIGRSQNIDSTGLKLTLTQQMPPYLLFSLPIFYKNDDGDAVTSTGPQTFGMDSLSMNPLMVFSLPVTTERDLPAKQQPLTLSIASGYRVGVTQKNDIRPIAPDVDGWTGTSNLLVSAEYAPKDDDEYSEWKITGNATWNHLTNFYSSKAGPRPDDNGFGLGVTFLYNFCPFVSNKKKIPRWMIKIGYQYDGFNRDQYQHSVTLAGNYRFW